MTKVSCTAKPPQPARPPSARFRRSAYCGGGERESVLIAAFRGWRGQSADRRSVLDSALVPEIVEPAGKRQLRARANITVKSLAVIADRLDDPTEPILGQPELLAKIAVRAKGSFQIRFVRFRHLVDVLLGDAKLLGIDHRKQH